MHSTGHPLNQRHVTSGMPAGAPEVTKRKFSARGSGSRTTTNKKAKPNNNHSIYFKTVLCTGGPKGMESSSLMMRSPPSLPSNPSSMTHPPCLSNRGHAFPNGTMQKKREWQVLDKTDIDCGRWK
ncbi:hypothetical protein CDAR_371581 [Caerostris darwini]|uniref:Uncharacterized protein n=1 Tax=Caerostris darwini TaxID=1538125 RepID=A0AAV4X9M8_9ARAC|nr:hypothetical protein CDAR_371581 [Caerostris darwini]